MRVAIPGGSGQIGQVLARGLRAAGHESFAVSRHPTGGDRGWDEDWANGIDAVINLAGRSVNCRYTPENRQEILQSRVESVKGVATAIERAKRPPTVWLQAATATIYAHRYDAPNDEATGQIEATGPDTWRFSLDVARAWEAALEEADVPGVRKIALRSAMTMSPDPDGVFDVFSKLVRRGLGGAHGDGRQYVSWIHEEDFVRATLFLLDGTMTGAVNLAAPNPLPNRDFMRILREAWGVPFGLPTPAPLLKLGAWAMGTETELILKSRRVVPGRLLDAGFEFEFSDWTSTARDLVARQRSLRLK